jgi:hypothetical protein
MKSTHAQTRTHRLRHTQTHRSNPQQRKHSVVDVGYLHRLLRYKLRHHAAFMRPLLSRAGVSCTDAAAAVTGSSSTNTTSAGDAGAAAATATTVAAATAATITACELRHRYRNHLRAL